MLYLEDFRVGQSFELGSRTLDEQAIIAFAKEYDPQPFHIDAAAGRASVYGGLIASGWHTVSVYMRLLVDGLLSRTASMGAPGVDEVKWLAPVRPGDTLTGRLEVLEVRESRSRPGLGFVAARCTMTNQDGEEVLLIRAPMMIRRRETGAG